MKLKPIVDIGRDYVDFSKLPGIDQEIVKACPENEEDKVLRHVLEAKSNADYCALECSETQWTLLHLAAMQNLVSVVDEILREDAGRKAAAKKVQTFALTPMQCAALGGHLPVVRALIATEEGRATVSEKDACKSTPVFLAAINGHEPALRELLKTKEGETVVNEADVAGQTPLHCAAALGHDHLLRLLLETGDGKRGMQMRNADGMTPKEFAEEYGRSKVVLVLNDYSPTEAFAPGLDCAVCLSRFSSTDESKKPFVVCENGHSFCFACTGYFGACPTCRIPCYPRPIANRSLIDAIETFKLSNQAFAD